jgi:beta-lactamase class D
MKYFIAVIVVLLAFPLPAAEWQENPEVGGLFEQAGINGTFVLYDIAGGIFRGHNEIRANRRFVPASTFKIPNSLIGLSLGAVKDVDDPLPYTGPAKPFIRAWAKEMGLREAIALSNVPIYQELARRIGLERMREQVAALDYGNMEIGSAVDTFWLKGPLRISAVEQARFLARLARGALPLPAAVQQSVREIVLLDRGPNWILYGKTGWENAPDPGVGWWVGWVEKEGRHYAFALNLDMRNASDGSRRLELGKASLKLLGIL